jgi:hypothetical protein
VFIEPGFNVAGGRLQMEKLTPLASALAPKGWRQPGWRLYSLTVRLSERRQAAHAIPASWKF